MNTTKINHYGLIRETEKAILLKHSLGYCSSVGRETQIWWPKSQIVARSKAEIEVPAWAAAKKLAEFSRQNRTPWFE